MKAILKKLLYEMLPQNIYCISCGKITDEENYMSICKDCIEKMNRSCEKRVCVKCGKILRRSFTDDICRDCANGFRNFEKGVSPFGYGFVERRIVSNFKSKNRPYMARYMGKLMADNVKYWNIEYDIAVCVPISKDKLASRGFNQSKLLAEIISCEMDRPFFDILYRDKNTKAMKKLDREERRENVRGAFKVKDYGVKYIKGKDILLVDDIFTTGATADECSLTLKNAGANRVYVISFAAGW